MPVSRYDETHLGDVGLIKRRFDELYSDWRTRKQNETDVSPC